MEGEMTSTPSKAVKLLNFTVDIYEQNNTKSEHGKLSTENILIIIIQLVLMISIIIGNSLVILAVIKFRNLRSVLYRFVASLAFADILVATVIPVNMLRHAEPIFNRNQRICLAVYGTSTVSFAASVFHLFCIAIDRCIALNNPLKYQTIMAGKSYKFIAVIWIVSIAVGIVPAFVSRRWEDNPKCTMQRVLDSTYMFVLCIIIIAIAVAMLVMYAQLFYVVQSHLNRTNIRNAQISCGTVSKIKKDAKAAKVLATVLLTFLICWMPFVSVVIVIYLGKTDTANKEYKTVSYFLAVFNSCLNPLIYAWMSKGMRAAFKTLLRLDRRSQTTDITDVANGNGAPGSLDLREEGEPL
ncbi:probable G-protein coupled receptor No18 [Lineus longissimus]|uniref:probable G-protein coupled receptor No18 n=1 Tax=Lineus longissimus TaxID=88925 RepID=UPI00315D8472